MTSFVCYFSLLENKTTKGNAGKLVVFNLFSKNLSFSFSSDADDTDANGFATIDNTSYFNFDYACKNNKSLTI